MAATRVCIQHLLTDERCYEAVRQWRNVEAHRRIQHAGRQSIFADYRLRVAHVVRDYGMNERAEAPDDSRKAHEQ